MVALYARTWHSWAWGKQVEVVVEAICRIVMVGVVVEVAEHEMLAQEDVGAQEGAHVDGPIGEDFIDEEGD